MYYHDPEILEGTRKDCKNLNDYIRFVTTHVIDGDDECPVNNTQAVLVLAMAVDRLTYVVERCLDDIDNSITSR